MFQFNNGWFAVGLLANRRITSHSHSIARSLVIKKKASKIFPSPESSHRARISPTIVVAPYNAYMLYIYLRSLCQAQIVHLHTLKTQNSSSPCPKKVIVVRELNCVANIYIIHQQILSLKGLTSRSSRQKMLRPLHMVFTRMWDGGEGAIAQIGHISTTR